MSDIAVKVENVSKLYQLGQIGTGTISRDIERWWARARGKEDPFAKIGQTNDRARKRESDAVWALKDINFQVKKGEVLGVIGRNGAGKSTLLKILSKVTAPTTGKIYLNGRIASLLEVGTGFHPEMTGRENIFMNGALLGMRKWEIKKKFDEIVDFAGVEAYIDTPVKRYSSGMYVRLAFAVAAYLEPEILIVDEVLAVGDAEFQKKCIGRMKDVSVNDGRTVLFVSHDLNAVQNICTSAVLMHNGQISAKDDPHAIIEMYSSSQTGNGSKWVTPTNNHFPHFTSIALELEGEQPHLVLKVNFSLQSVVRHKAMFVAFDVSNNLSIPLMQAIPINEPFLQFSESEQSFCCSISLDGFVPGKYLLSAWMGEHNTLTTDWQKEILGFEILNSPIQGRTMPHSPKNGFIIANSNISQL